MWQLVINGPGYFDTVYELPEGVTSLGRGDDNDIVLSGDLVSRKHACIIVGSSELFVEDLGSRNGSAKNDVEFKERQSLSAGDVLRIGENTLTLRKQHHIERAATEMVVFDKGVRPDNDSSIVVSRNVRDSFLLRALDNVGQVPQMPGPFSDGQTPSLPMEYDALLLLYRLIERLGGATTLKDFFEESLDRLIAQWKALDAVVLLKDSWGKTVPHTVRRHTEEPVEVPIAQSMVDRAWERKEALYITDSDDASYNKEHPLVCVPLGQNSPFWGALYVRLSKPPNDVEAILEIATAVAHLIDAGVSRWGLDSIHGTDAASVLTPVHASVLAMEVEGVAELLEKSGPGKAGAWLQDFYQKQAEIVQSFQGQIQGVPADSLMAVFGLSGDKKDSAVRSVRAALVISNEWQKHMMEVPPSDRLALKLGIHTGRSWAGWVLAKGQKQFVSLGPAFRIASLLMQMARPGQILISGNTFTETGTRFEVSPLGERAFEGGRLLLPVMEVVAEDLAHRTNPKHA